MLHDIEMLNFEEQKRNLKRKEKGIRDYVFLMKNRHNIDAEFIKKYKAFYRVRRNDAFCETYFKCLEENISRGIVPNTEDVLNELYLISHKIEISFTSKLLATIDPRHAIWDSRVLHKLKSDIEKYDPDKKYISIRNRGYELKGDKITSACYIYNILGKILNDLLASPVGKSYIQLFDEAYNEMFKDDADMNYEISNIKKIDFILWS